MGTVESITKRLKSERHDVAVQARISAQDAELLDEFVDFLSKVGVQANRSGAVRALVLDGLQAFEEFRAENPLRSSTTGVHLESSPKAQALENAPKP